MLHLLIHHDLLNTIYSRYTCQRFITTTEEFNSVIQSEQPVIVKFEAGWCPDCKAMDK
jgi:thiol-disulfide isomerase/thioredoxin